MRFQVFFFLFLICLNASAQREMETLVQTGHDQAVTSISSGGKGKYILSGSKDHTIKLWDFVTGLEIRTYFGHDFKVTGVDMSPDQKFLVSCSAGGYFMLHDILDSQPVLKGGDGKDVFTSIKFIDNRTVALGGYGKEVLIWDIYDDKGLSRIPVNPASSTGYGVQISVSEDGKIVALGEDNRSVNLIDVESWEVLRKIEPDKGWCGGCGTFTAFNETNASVLIMPENANPYIVDSLGGKIVEFPVELDDPIGGFFYPASDTVLIAEEKRAFLCNSVTGTLLDTLLFENQANEMSLVGSKYMAIALNSNVVEIFALNTLTKVKELSGILNKKENDGLEYDPNSYWQAHIAKYLRLKNPLLFLPEAQSYIKGKSGIKAKSWNIEEGKPGVEFSGHNKAVIDIKYDSEIGLMATAGADGKILIWSLNNHQLVKVIQAHQDPIFSIDFNPTYNQIISSSWDGTIKIWNLETGEMLNRINTDNNSAYQVAFTPDGLYFVAAGLGKKLELWEPDSKTIIRDFAGHTDVVSAIDFSVDGREMLSASWDGSIRIWDIRSGMMVDKFLTKTKIYDAKYVDSGNQVYYSGSDRDIHIIDMETKGERKLVAHRAAVTSFDIDSEKKSMISYSLDGVVKVWDLESEKPLFDHIHIGAYDWMVLNQEGYFSGTEGAISNIHFVKKLQPYQAEQFFNKFYRPDIIRKSSRSGYKGGYLQGPAKELEKKPLPQVRVAAIKDLKEERAILMIEIMERGGGAENLKILHNGKRVQLKGINYPGYRKTLVYTDTLKMVGGKNVFSVTIQNSEGLESFPANAELFSESSERSSTCHILAIGLNKYKNSLLDLSYAKGDAEEFSKEVIERGSGLFKNVVVHSLYDDNAQRSNILDTLDKLSEEIMLHDVFIFYYAGHGSYQDSEFYLIPNECARVYEERSLEKYAISASTLQEKFQAIQALKQIVIMDACHSGGSVEVLASRGAQEERAVAQLARSAGVHILASSGEEQSSKEVDELKHGIFTYVLLKGIRGEADGAPKDGKITIFELKSYIDDQVPLLNEKYSGKAQYPYTFSRGQDFPVCLDGE